MMWTLYNNNKKWTMVPFPCSVSNYSLLFITLKINRLLLLYHYHLKWQEIQQKIMLPPPPSPRDGGTKIAIPLVLHPSPSTKKCGNNWEIKIEVPNWPACQKFYWTYKTFFSIRKLCWQIPRSRVVVNNLIWIVIWPFLALSFNTT